MLSRLSPVVAEVSPPRHDKLDGMLISSAVVFRMRQAIRDLNEVVFCGRDSIARFSLRAHAEGLPKLMANKGRFRLPEDRDFYSDVLLAAAMPEEDFPAFTTATAILLVDLLQNGEGSDDLYWNWDTFQNHYRLADPAIRAALMNGYRVGYESGAVRLEASPDPLDCLTISLDPVLAILEHAGKIDLLLAIGSAVTSSEAGEIWEKFGTDGDDYELPGFRYLYEREGSMTPANPETAPLIPWS